MKPYEEMSDAELSEAFALQVAGWSVASHGFWEDKSGELIWNEAKQNYELPDFATSADAILPWLCNNTCAWSCNGMIADIVSVEVQPAKNFPNGPFIGTAAGNQFARAACIALLKAKKSETAT